MTHSEAHPSSPRSTHGAMEQKWIIYHSGGTCTCRASPTANNPLIPHTLFSPVVAAVALSETTTAGIEARKAGRDGCMQSASALQAGGNNPQHPMCSACTTHAVCASVPPHHAPVCLKPGPQLVPEPN